MPAYARPPARVSLATIAFGGAGPAHAAAVARILGSPTVIFPPGAGVASAFWVASDAMAREQLRRHVAAFAEPFEGRVFTELQEMLPAGATIVAGNSMPVRDLDSFVVAAEKPLNLVANRGANGIDGTIATAFGVAAASTDPVTLLIGDVAFLHDLGGLAAGTRLGLRLTIVLVDNDGGGIFDFLPVGDAQPDGYAEHVTTAPGLDPPAIAAAAACPSGVANRRETA